MRQSSYHFGRSVTTGSIFRRPGSTDILENEDSPDENRKSGEPLVPPQKKRAPPILDSPIMKPKPYVTPSSQMIPKVNLKSTVLFNKYDKYYRQNQSYPNNHLMEGTKRSLL